MRQRRHIPADRMQVSLPNSIQLSLFGSNVTRLVSAVNTLAFPQPETTQLRLIIGDTLTDQSGIVLPTKQELAAFNAETSDRRNFRLTADLFNPKTLGERIKANVTAIRLAKIIHAEGREATADEKAQLVQFSGWGGLTSAFEEASRFLSVLDEVLTTEERQAAATSCLTAFYTPPTLITAIWQAVEQAGFTGGRILEPGAGIGHFVGFTPSSISDRAEWVAVEKDPIAGMILRLLYPDATVEVSGFEQIELTNGSFDLVIGNVPFGAYSVYDRQNSDLSAYPIHNYFIGKSARLVKPGGLLALVTSSGTLDQSGDEFRRWLTRQAEAELVGAIRLPSCAFESHSGTSVTADVLFLQRRDGVNRQFAGHSFERTVSVRSRIVEDEGEPMTTSLYVNEYFAQRPGLMLGKWFGPTKWAKAVYTGLTGRPYT